MPGVVDGRLDLGPVADDALVAHQPRDVAGREARDGGSIEAPERRTEVLAFAQYREPAQPGHEALERKLLEQPAVIGDRTPPLRVVVVAHVIRIPPPAARNAVGAD